MPTIGHCLCRKIQYQYDGEPTHVVHRHCESCRRQTSSSVATFVIVPKAALRFTQGQPKEFASSPACIAASASACGSPIYYRSERRTDQIDLYAGTLSDPAAVPARVHVYAADSYRGSKSSTISHATPDRAARPNYCGMDLADSALCRLCRGRQRHAIRLDRPRVIVSVATAPISARMPATANVPLKLPVSPTT